MGPAAPHQSDDAVSNPDEERCELEERLKTLRLELASELQVPNLCALCHPPQHSRLLCESRNVCSQQAVDEEALLATLEV